MCQTLTLKSQTAKQKVDIAETPRQAHLKKGQGLHAVHIKLRTNKQTFVTTHRNGGSHPA